MTVLKEIEQERVTKLSEVTVQFSKYSTIDDFIKNVGAVLKKWI
jgi:hypothetical protein